MNELLLYQTGVIECVPTVTHNHHYNSIQGRIELILLHVSEMELGLVN